PSLVFFFLTLPAPSDSYTLSLHDALPICRLQDALPVGALAGPPARRCLAGECPPRQRMCPPARPRPGGPGTCAALPGTDQRRLRDRKSTRLNSSHLGISYAVFCLKKKKHK